MRHQRGNILFLILLAVILFAALSYAVTSSMKGGGNDASEEKMKAVAGQLLQNVNLLENTMMRGMLSNKIPDYGFDVSSTSTNSVANATCTGGPCVIYSDKGGPVPAFQLPDSVIVDGASSTQKRAYYRVTEIVDVGTTTPDVTILFIKLKPEFCALLNKILGVDIDLNVQDSWGGGGAIGYSGTQTQMPASTARIGDLVTGARGRHSFCYQGNGSDGYIFTHVLMVK